jgi:hypothetical protein
MSIAARAYDQLFPGDKRYNNFSLAYSARFGDYSGNIRYSPSRGTMDVRLSKKWDGVSEEIQIGLIQSLMLKAVRKKLVTMNIELYNIFMQKIHVAAPRTGQEPDLKASFDRINERHFGNQILPCNLVWGGLSMRRLGTYSYGDDTITISSVLKGQDELIDYVMYHEMLHKKVKWNPKSGRSVHHTREFRRLEAQYPDAAGMELRLKRYLATRRLRKVFWFS